MEQESPFKLMAEKWPSPIVARSAIEKFSGGLFTTKSLANYDYWGTGPAGRFRVGRKIAYRVTDLVEWMERRTKSVEQERSK